MTAEKSIRAFLALDSPEAVIREIAAIQTRLKKVIQGDIRWVRPEGIHLTLKFFGNISVDDIVNIADVVEKNVTDMKPLDLTVRRLGCFPDMKRPRVVWLGTEGDVEKLVALQKKLEDGFRTLGFPPEERHFRAHLTIGRIKMTKGLTDLTQAILSGEAMTAGRFRAGCLCLFRSELKPSGAAYTKLAEFPFGG